jgi:hypothetical protein
MDELTARLESLLSRYRSVLDQGKDDDGGKTWDEFRKELQLLIAEYGASAVDAALNDIPDGAAAEISLH